MANAILPAAALAFLLAAPAGAADIAANYCLYRTSMVEGIGRIYIAAFDAEDGREYNRENCGVAARLFMGQPGTKTQFYCQPAVGRCDQQDVGGR